MQCRYSDIIKQAKQDADACGIPHDAYRRFRAQVQSAKRRGLAFEFTLPQWWAWWQTDDRWATRGLSGDGLVMARHGDLGGYSPGNVYCATNAQNLRDVPRERRSAANKRAHQVRKAEGRPWHLEVRGDEHPKSRAVITPSGRYGSAALAAEAHGITRQGAAYRARQGKDGWRYE